MEELCAIEGKSLIKIVLEESIPFQGYIIYNVHVRVYYFSLLSQSFKYCTYYPMSGMYICLSVYLSVYLSVCLTDCLTVCLTDCLSVCLSICLFLSVYLSLYTYSIIFYYILISAAPVTETVTQLHDYYPMDQHSYFHDRYNGGPDEPFQQFEVRLVRQVSGFGFRIIGGREEGSQATIGGIVPGGAANIDGRLMVCE